VAKTVARAVTSPRRRAAPRWGGRPAAGFGDTMIYVTADELTSLAERVEELLAPYTDRARRAEGSRPVTMVQLSIPTPETGAP
jgi:hypothetical protein